MWAGNSLDLLLEQDLGDPLGGRLLAWRCRTRALDEREPDSMPNWLWRFGLLKATTEQISDQILELAVLSDSPDLHFSHEVVGQVECGLHGASIAG